MAHNLEQAVDTGSAGMQELKLGDQCSCDVGSVTHKSQVEEPRSVDELSLRMLSSRLFYHELNVKSKTDSFNFEFQVCVRKEEGSGEGESPYYRTLNRDPILALPNYSYFQIASVGTNVFDFQDLQEIELKGDDQLVKAACLHGDITANAHSNYLLLYRLTKMKDEGRMLALKAVLCLKQLALFYSLSGVFMTCEPGELHIKLARWEEVVDAAVNRSFLVNATELSKEEVTILANLTREWPFQQVIFEGDKTKRWGDIYARARVRADDAYIYNTTAETSVSSGILYTPDQYWKYTVSLFNSLGMLDHLYEVLRDTRGLIPAVSRYFGSGAFDHSEPLALRLKYGETTSVRTVFRIGSGSPSTHVLDCKLPPSTTTVVLDLLMGYMFWNNVHHLVEELALGSSSMYPSEEALNSTLSDYGYNSNGPDCKLYSRLMPWVPAICGGGQVLRRMTLDYASALHKYHLSASEDQFDLRQWTFIPLGFYYKQDSRLTSEWALHNKHGINRNLMEVGTETEFDIYTWTGAVGLDGEALPFGGALLAGGKQKMENDRMREAFHYLRGIYHLEDVILKLKDLIAFGRPSSNNRIATLFSPFCFAQPSEASATQEAKQEEHQKSTTSVTVNDEMSRERFRDVHEDLETDKRNFQEKLLSMVKKSTVEEQAITSSDEWDQKPSD